MKRLKYGLLSKGKDLLFKDLHQNKLTFINIKSDSKQISINCNVDGDRVIFIISTIICYDFSY